MNTYTPNVLALQSNGHTRLQEFLDALNAKHGGVGGGNGSFITGLPGDRYVRIIHANGGNSAYAFIEIATGNILKPASWKSPAKHARGNIFADDHGLSCCGRFSVAYLSGGRS
jgi:hypothetical protein